jgi:hypothetical protein
MPQRICFRFSLANLHGVPLNIESGEKNIHNHLNIKQSHISNICWIYQHKRRESVSYSPTQRFVTPSLCVKIYSIFSVTSHMFQWRVFLEWTKTRGCYENVWQVDKLHKLFARHSYSTIVVLQKPKNRWKDEIWIVKEISTSNPNAPNISSQNSSDWVGKLGNAETEWQLTHPILHNNESERSWYILSTFFQEWANFNTFFTT